MGRKAGNISKREFVRQCAALSAGMLCVPRHIISAGINDETQNDFRREAMFQEKTPRGVMCRICPNECILKEGELSQCRNRKVIRSVLYTLAYGNPCSVNVDPIEKKPLYHFLPGTRAFSIATAGCNLACLNCQNWTISQTGPDKTRNVRLMPDKVVSESLARSCSSIAYTYSEPITFYEYVFDTAFLAKQAGIKNLLISNGYINPEPLRKLCTVIDAANIDLKSFNDSTYLRLSGGKLQAVLDTLLILKDQGVWLEITNLIVPGWTDNPDEIRKMCTWLSRNGFSRTPIHFSRFHPTYKLEQLPPTPVEVLNTAVKIARDEGLQYIYIGNVPGHGQSDTVCPGCGTGLIIRQGFRIVSDKLAGNKCSKCGRVIDGIWS